MKLIRFGDKGAEKPGILWEGVRKDCSSAFPDWDHAFFNSNGIASLQQYVSENAQTLPTVPEQARWASCIARPGMILCVGLNYAAHAEESSMDLPQEPIVFGKATNTISGPHDNVMLPKNASKTDYEVELGVVLGKNASYLDSEEAAASCIAGYCVANDLSERAFQLERGGQWIKGKSAPGFCPVGPYLLTSDELNDTSDLTLQLSVNGETRQQGSTQMMIFRPAYLVYYLSQFMTLEAGDLILTGTPPGVGMGMQPPTYLKAGDALELSIAQLGSQQQKIIPFQALSQDTPT